MLQRWILQPRNHSHCSLFEKLSDDFHGGEQQAWEQSERMNFARMNRSRVPLMPKNSKQWTSTRVHDTTQSGHVPDVDVWWFKVDFTNLLIVVINRAKEKEKEKKKKKNSIDSWINRALNRKSQEIDLVKRLPIVQGTSRGYLNAINMSHDLKDNSKFRVLVENFFNLK